MNGVEKAMEIVFLGTGAADYSAEALAKCAGVFSKDCRRASAILINGSLLVDCGPHVPESLRILGTCKTGIQGLLFTHTHPDHFSGESVRALALGREKPLDIWCEERAADRLRGLENTALHPLKAGENVRIGGVAVTALPANHRVEGSDEQPLHYAFEREGKKLFYGCDGAWFLTPTFYYLMHKRFDLFVFDGTVGDYDGDYRICEHNSIPMIRTLIRSMRGLEVFGDECKLYISHLARTLHPSHEEVSAKLLAENIHTAYDGLTEWI